jgi:hypothetical protein
MNRISSKSTIANQSHIAASLLAVVLAFAGMSQAATNQQIADSTATPPAASGQVDPPASQPDQAQTEQAAPAGHAEQPGAMSAPDSGNAHSNSKQKASDFDPYDRSDENWQRDIYVCTPDTPSTSAACNYL